MFLEHFLQGFFLFGHLASGNSFPKPISADEEKEHFRRYAEGNEDSRNLLVEHNLRLVAHVAKKYNNHAKESEDLISVGTIGLIKAVVAYSPERGARLSTYAIRCIENEILMYLRNIKKNAGNISLQEISSIDREGNEIHLEDKVADIHSDTEELVTKKLQATKLREAINFVLHGREKTVIQMRYGFGDTKKEMTQQEISKELNISRSYVSRIEKKAIGKLRKEMAQNN